MNTVCFQSISFLVIFSLFSFAHQYNPSDLRRFRERVQRMFIHAHSNYMSLAYPKDELLPLSCRGKDTYAGYSLTLIDSLDSLFVMGLCEQFKDAYQKALKVNFDLNVNVSIFETNIRVVGGLLAGHLVAPHCGVQVPDNWPCEGEMLEQARSLADRLLKAFDTPTGMPIGTVNLRHGIPENEIDISSTAGIGSYIVEFGCLSRLTGDGKYVDIARKALDALWNTRSSLDLVGNHINVTSGLWTDPLFTIGSAVDSYLEYLLKGSILLDDKELNRRFHAHIDATTKYAKLDNHHHIYVSSLTGTPHQGLFQSLDAYYPGMLILAKRDIAEAFDILLANHKIWLRYGALPEKYNLFSREIVANGREYPLRPEHIESVVYALRILNNMKVNAAAEDDNATQIRLNVLVDVLTRVSVDVLTSIEAQMRTECGFAGLKDVRTNRLQNRMESFFLAETLKYLYLAFDPENVVFTGPYKRENTKIKTSSYIFNTEGHLIDTGATDYCNAFHRNRR